MIRTLDRILLNILRVVDFLNSLLSTKLQSVTLKELISNAPLILYTFIRLYARQKWYTFLEQWKNMYLFRLIRKDKRVELMNQGR